MLKEYRTITEVAGPLLVVEINRNTAPKSGRRRANDTIVRAVTVTL
ncbi:hypothetical protein KAH81_00430 [bacterium]|nr:hypothetical protein [bacterium]